MIKKRIIIVYYRQFYRARFITGLSAIFATILLSCSDTLNHPSVSQSATKATQTSQANLTLEQYTQLVNAENTLTSRTLSQFNRPHVLQDTNPAPNIVEVNIEAKPQTVEFSPGVTSQVWTYNELIPGPLIMANKGDRLIVHFTNNLPEPTTIHWHGLQLPADMDGSTVAQNPIQPGRSFQYDFILPDAGLYWYHPHVRSNEQVEKGLAGTLLVRDKMEPMDIQLIPQHLLVLDDILLDDNGQIPPAFVGTIEEQLLEKLNGREGNILLVNGHQIPRYTARVNAPVRLRLVNIANTRFMKISIPEHKLTRIGGDGGLLNTAITDLETVMLVPGQRADVIFTPDGEPGSTITVYWNDHPRGRHTINIMPDGTPMMGDDETDGNHPRLPLFEFKLADNPYGKVEFEPPVSLNSITPIDTTNAAIQTLRFGHTMPTANGNIGFTINGKSFSEITSADTPKASVGQTQVWELVNMTGADHPFHLHGFFFQVLETIEMDETGNMIKMIPPPPLENVDMVNLPQRPGPMGSMTTVKIAIKFDPGHRTPDQIIANGGIPAIINAEAQSGVQGHSGGWQFHCHILEHADLGMMSFFEIQ